MRKKKKSVNVREEPKKAPIMLLEDNLTKAKRALMAQKQLCPTGLNIRSLERKTNIRKKMRKH